MNDVTKKNVVAASYPNQPATIPARSETPMGHASRLADAAAFLRGFLAHPVEAASVVPSSVFLENRVVQAADLARARCVVELGPGTGGSTRALLRALAPQAWLLAIEVNPGFSGRLRRLIDDPRLGRAHCRCDPRQPGARRPRGRLPVAAPSGRLPRIALRPAAHGVGMAQPAADACFVWVKPALDPM